jgi:hypothetical protein
LHFTRGAPCWSVRRLLCALGLLLAWLCANGAALDLMQVFAWGRMFAGYAHEMPVETALARTFDPAQPCPLCRAVQAARRAGREHSPASPPVPAAKLILISQPPEAVRPPAVPGRRLDTGPVGAAVRHDPVPVPPPRFGAEC